MTDLNTLENASISFDGKSLIVKTGKMSRTWAWTGFGFLTKFIQSETDTPWGEKYSLYNADWVLPTCEENNPAAEIISYNIEHSDDEGFTSQHIEFKAKINYPTECLSVLFIVWVWPDSPGVRTQLKIKTIDGFSFSNNLHKTENTEDSRRIARLERGYQRSEYLPIDLSNTKRAYFGYYSDTQNRNDCSLDLLLEDSDSHHSSHTRVIEWANAICIENENCGIALLKESHKCVNQRGVDTGTFNCIPGLGLENTGWGILPDQLTEQWQSAWATWCLVYPNSHRARERAFKQFDKTRYPMSQNDIYLQANTWGSSQGYLEHREAANEISVLKEIDVCSELGIDILQIDDGWQGNDYKNWTPDQDRYESNWDKVKQRAAKKNVDLGLWLAAVPPTVEDLLRNAKEGGFKSFKLDFAVLKNRNEIETLINKVREFVKTMNHRVRVNWDLTEVCPRYGFYFAREFGCIYLENRKPVIPRSTTYRPAAVLRDLWQVSKYCNLLKFQGSVQNIDRVDPHYSDAAAYRHDTCLAMTLFSSPLYFCEMKFFSEEAKATIKPLIEVYKDVRSDIVKGITYPIGLKPDGTQWTGFDCMINESKGYLLIFREPWNSEAEGVFPLDQLKNQHVVLSNLMNKKSENILVDTKGEIKFEIDPGAYLFLKYEKT